MGLNQGIIALIDDLNVDDNVKQFIKESLIYEFECVDEINPRFLPFYDNLIDAYLQDD